MNTTKEILKLENKMKNAKTATEFFLLNDKLKLLIKYNEHN